MSTPDKAQIDAVVEQLRRDAEQAGYFLNPDMEFTRARVEGLLTNEARYGYRACPCRLASGDAARDLDIVCPCDYRDEDLAEFGACYCALYVSEEIANGLRTATPIPERRPRPGAAPQAPAQPAATPALAYPVWRCKVCGYLCARNSPPGLCPICKAAKERFERFM